MLSTTITTFFVISISYVIGQPEFIRRASLEDCESCCSQVSAVSGSEVNIDDCQTPGCFRVPGEDQLCSDLLGEDIADLSRFSCEVGRDMFTSGITSLLDETQLFLCNEGTLEAIEIDSVDTDNLALSEDACDQCCTLANERDGGVDDEPDDFREDTCRAACNSQDVTTCFEFEEHRDRTGCLFGLELIQSGTAELEEVAAVCNDGIVIFERISSEEEEEDSEEDVLDSQLVLIAAGIGVGLIILLLVVILIMWTKRTTQFVLVDEEGTVLATSVGSPRKLEVNMNTASLRAKKSSLSGKTSDFPGIPPENENPRKRGFASFNGDTLPHSEWSEMRSEKAPSF